MRNLLNRSRIALAGALLSACGGQLPPAGYVPNSTELALSGQPSASYDPSTGKTTLAVQFTARVRRSAAEALPTPLDRTTMRVDVQVNGRPLDNEALLREDSEALSSNVVYGLVLDASYSMLQHQPPAFEPMKRAAKASIDRGAALWAAREGSFTSVVSWFDEWLYMQEAPWRSDDVLSLPTPKAGTATRLFAAVEAMGAHLRNLYEAGNAAGARDRHLMLVFSDGADNLSWFSNPTVSERLVTTTGAPYVKRGAAAVSLSDAIAALKSHPRLTVHVIGLGSQVDEAELRGLASAGGGQYFANPRSEEIDRVFERVTNEFGSVHTLGATIPIPPGEHQLTLKVTPLEGGVTATCVLPFTAGEQAHIAEACQQ